MIATKSTAVATETTSTPSRRSSWKSESELQEMLPQSSDEKSAIDSTSDNPFSDIHHVHTVPHIRLSNKVVDMCDIEAQDYHPFGRFRKGRLYDCLAIYCILLVWFLFVFGAYMLMETVFPGSLPSIREVQVDLGSTKERVDMLKAQVGTLYAHVGSLRMGDVVGLSWGNGTMGWMGGNGTGGA
jgi:hypothetical protein